MGTNKNDIQRFVEYFSDRDHTVEWQSRDTVDQLRKSWIDTLCDSSHEKRLQSQQFLWHMFSGRYAACVEGVDAFNEYQRLKIGDNYIWTDQHGLGVLKVGQARPPDLAVVEGAYLKHSFLADVYVASITFEWILAVTHERDAGYGPYFAKSRWRNA